MQRTSVASACLLLGSFLVGGMGLLWFCILIVGLVVGAAGISGAAFATTVMDYDLPNEVVMTGGGLYVGAIALMTVLATVNLIAGVFGLLTAFRGLTGRTWGVRTAAVVQIVMALVFGLPGAITMNPLALVWAAVLVFAIATLIVVPREAPPIEA